MLLVYRRQPLSGELSFIHILLQNLRIHKTQTRQIYHTHYNMIASLLLTDYAYVALTAVGTLWLNLFQVIVVSKARAEVRSASRLRRSSPTLMITIQAGLAYPVYMADNSVAEKNPKAFRFNCSQRG